MPGARIGGGNWPAGVCLAATLAIRAQRIVPLMNAAAAVVVAFWLLPMVVPNFTNCTYFARGSLALVLFLLFQSLPHAVVSDFLDSATDELRFRTRNNPETSEQASPISGP